MARTAVQYLLEIEENGKVTRSFALPPAARISIEPRVAMSRRWTLGQYPIKQKSGYRELRITVSGVSGNRPRRTTEINGSGDLVTGDQLFGAYLDFLAAYAKSGALTEGPILRRPSKERQRLIFRSIKGSANGRPNTDTFAYYCEVESNPQSHDVDSLRMQWGYELNLVTEGPVARTQAIPYGTPAQQSASIEQINQLTNASLSAVAPQGVIDATSVNIDGVSYGSLVQLQKELPVAFQFFRAPINDFIRTLNTLKGIGGVIRTTVGFPRNVIMDVANAAAASIEVLETLWDSIPGAERTNARDWFNRAYNNIEAIRIKATATIGLSNKKLDGRGTVAGTSITNGVQSRNGQIVKSAEMIGGETLTQFCFRVLGDPGRYREVMELNDMPSPFEAANGVPLSSGMSLIVPVPLGVPQTPRDNRDIFGCDLLMEDGDLVMAGTTDISVVRGRPNLEQALTRRLLAVRGENQAFPAWGMPPLVGEAAIAGTAGYIASQVREQVEADSRVVSVDQIEVQSDGSVYEAAFSIATVDGEITSVVAPVPA